MHECAGLDDFLGYAAGVDDHQPKRAGSLDGTHDLVERHRLRRQGTSDEEQPESVSEGRNSRHRRHRRQHDHLGFLGYAIVKVDDVLVEHPDAAARDRTADAPWLGGSVDAV
jgi:hypothetical protein